jgi:hypothetical protein
LRIPPKRFIPVSKSIKDILISTNLKRKTLKEFLAEQIREMQNLIDGKNEIIRQRDDMVSLRQSKNKQR